MQEAGKGFREKNSHREKKSLNICYIVGKSRIFCNPIIVYPCHSLINSCLVDLIDVTLACEDANSKLVEVVTVDDVDAEDHVGNSLLQIWKLTFGPKAKLLFRL